MYITEPYDIALKTILEKGVWSKNRTGVDTKSIFGMECVYDVSTYFPLLTKRKIFYKGVFAELIWMLSGDTNVRNAKKLGCNFWDEFVDLKNPKNVEYYRKTGFPPGVIGPVYGWCMRHFGGDYYGYLKYDNFKFQKSCNVGFDQISWLISEINKNPTSRSLIVSLWNPAELHLMRLQPCAWSFQISIDVNTRNMSLLLNQRSNDFFLGVPSNIVSYSALLYMIAAYTDYKPYKLIHHMGDCHIYANQIDAVKEYLDSPEQDSPKLCINYPKILMYNVDNFQVVGYNPTKIIKVPVIV